MTGLPRLDEHAIEIAAEATQVWAALLETVDGLSTRAATIFASAVACDDRRAAGPRPLEPGSTVPGFHVNAVAIGRNLVLGGRHRFSSNELVFRLEEVGAGRTRLRAESSGVFPGLLGRGYRLLLLRTGGHVAAVRRLLRAVQRGAEQAA